METRSQTRRRAILEWLRDFVRSAREPTTEDFLFASQIDTETLNRMCPEGPNKGKSVAFFLAGTQKGQAILACNNCALALQITADRLNQVVVEGTFKGQSVAFFLARTPEGQAILAHNNCALGLQITAATLNQVIEEGPHKGKSVAFLLSETEKGRSLLKDKNYALGELIINRDEMTPTFNEGPRYFENPELLLKFMKMFPDRRADIEKEAPAYVEQLKRFIKLRGTCKALHGFKPLLGDDKGIPDYLEKELMMALCRYSMPVNDEKEAPDDPSNREVKRRR